MAPVLLSVLVLDDRDRVARRCIDRRVRRGVRICIHFSVLRLHIVCCRRIVGRVHDGLAFCVYIRGLITLWLPTTPPREEKQSDHKCKKSSLKHKDEGGRVRVSKP